MFTLSVIRYGWIFVILSLYVCPVSMKENVESQVTGNENPLLKPDQDANHAEHLLPPPSRQASKLQPVVTGAKPHAFQSGGNFQPFNMGQWKYGELWKKRESSEEETNTENANSDLEKLENNEVRSYPQYFYPLTGERPHLHQISLGQYQKVHPRLAGKWRQGGIVRDNEDLITALSKRFNSRFRGKPPKRPFPPFPPFVPYRRSQQSERLVENETGERL